MVPLPWQYYSLLLFIVLTGNCVCRHARECKTTTLGKEYDGHVNVTHSGRICQRWDVQEPHGNTVSYLFSDGTGTMVENWCRNPDSEPEGPWCYTMDAKERWEYCDIEVCKSTTPRDERTIRTPLPDQNNISTDQVHNTNTVKVYDTSIGKYSNTSIEVNKTSPKVYKTSTKVNNTYTVVNYTSTEMYNTNTEVYNISTEMYNTFPEVYNTSVELYHIRPEVYNTNNEVYNTSTEIHNTITNVHNISTEAYNTITKVYNTSTDVYNTSPEVYKTGVEVYNTSPKMYNTNTEMYNISTMAYNTNIAMDNTSSTVHSISTKVYSTSTEGYLRCRAIDNSKLHASNNTELETVEVQCDAGYWIKRGVYATSIRCLESGVWSYENISCKEMRCPNVTTWDGKSLSTKNTSVGTFVNTSCPVGTELDTGRSMLHCGENGLWDDQMPYCTNITPYTKTVFAPVEAPHSAVVGSLEILMVISFILFILVLHIIDVCRYWNRKRRRETKRLLRIQKLIIA